MHQRDRTVLSIDFFLGDGRDTSEFTIGDDGKLYHCFPGHHPSIVENDDTIMHAIKVVIQEYEKWRNR